MSVPKKKRVRHDVARSYRFDPETVALINRLRGELRDPETGQRYTATDILRMAIRRLAGQGGLRESRSKKSAT